MEGYRTRQPGLWDDAEWSELGLPPEPVTPETVSETAEDTLPMLEIAEAPVKIQNRSSSWD